MKTRIFGVILQIFFRACPPDYPTMVLPSALFIILICGITVQQNFRPPMETFCVRHLVQVSILFQTLFHLKFYASLES